ncbi:hypothetical protein FB570_111323 [Streptomyces sp. T12]|nr:hypothetical protein FB570_111323 [Streptomyces sp. T12]
MVSSPRAPLPRSAVGATPGRTGTLTAGPVQGPRHHPDPAAPLGVPELLLGHEDHPTARTPIARATVRHTGPHPPHRHRAGVGIPAADNSAAFASSHCASVRVSGSYSARRGPAAPGSPGCPVSTSRTCRSHATARSRTASGNDCSQSSCGTPDTLNASRTLNPAMTRHRVRRRAGAAHPMLPIAAVRPSLPTPVRVRPGARDPLVRLPYTPLSSTATATFSLIQCVSRRPGTMQRPGVAARTGQRMPGSPLAVKASSKSGIRCGVPR